MERLIAHLPEGAALYPEDFLTDLPERFFVSEIVREKILRMTRDELPYSTGVVIDSFEEKPELVRIEASIFVERDTQKAIVIGKGGADAEGHRDRGPAGHRGLPGREGVPGPVREGPRALARGSPGSSRTWGWGTGGGSRWARSYFKGQDPRQVLEKKMREEGRLPPGQSASIKWPVLHVGAEPEFDPADVGLQGRRAGREPAHPHLGGDDRAPARGGGDRTSTA